MSSNRGVRIGCSSAFWGDSVTAAHQLVKFGNIDYLVADYLAEVTMGILAKARKHTTAKGGAGDGGYVAEFLNFVWKPLMNDILSRNIRVVTNAGGLNPRGLKRAIEQLCREAGVEIPCVAAIEGDDILSEREDLMAKGSFKPFQHVSGNKSTEEFFPSSDKKIESLNAYIGAGAIKGALDAGAKIVVTGRCVDSAIVLGALMHEFKWTLTDYDLLAAGSLAGHIIECGCQATGGNFTDWRKSAFSANGGWSNMGYPIVECRSDGSFIVSKPDKTGGLVTTGTVGEQMVYEIGDPGCYILPDVLVDMRAVSLKQIGQDKVLVSGARGRPPTPFLKVSGVYMDGMKVTGELFIGGQEAKQKAESVGRAVAARAEKLVKKLGMDGYRGVEIETLGAEYTYGSKSRGGDSREVVLRLTAWHDNLQALRVFLMEIPPSATCMAPGIIGVSGGRPRPSGNMVHFSVLVDKAAVIPRSIVGLQEQVTKYPFSNVTTQQSIPPLPKPSVSAIWDGKPLGKTKVSLIKICLARSGDKGDSANIGVICRKPEFYQYLDKHLTEEVVAAHLAHLMTSNSVVKKFHLPGIYAFNFLVTQCLGGGGLSSLRIDRQGKSYGQLLLSLELDVPTEWLVEHSNL